MKSPITFLSLSRYLEKKRTDLLNSKKSTKVNVSARKVCFVDQLVRGLYEINYHALLYTQNNKDISFSSLKDLSGEEKESLERLCHLAFHMTINSKHVECEASSCSAQASFFGLATGSNNGNVKSWDYTNMVFCGLSL